MVVYKVSLCMILSLVLSSMSIYDINFEDSKTGKPINLSEYRGNKAIMIVNTASMCGFTKQYGAMQRLWDDFKDKNFILIAVPTNDFGGQEPKTNEEIVDFCETNFGINFLIAKKVTSKGSDTHPFFKLVTQDFGKSAGPSWNFYKYLYSQEGKPISWFSSFRSPDSEYIKSYIENMFENNE